jgi:DmsE family decaheme c-type cytochrome
MEGLEMKSLKKIVTTCMLLGALWTVTAAMAADPPAVTETVAPVAATVPAPANKDAACLKCHSETKPLTLYQTKHGVRGDSRAPLCVNCHGESATHLADKKASPDVVFKKGTFASSEVKAMNGSCLACHNKDSSRHNWMGSAHQVNDVACISCHSIHATHDKVREKATQADVCFTCHKEQRVEMNKMSHHPVKEGKMSCSDCHNLHGSAGPKLLKKNTVNQTCYTCHAEKRGPFLWEHMPVTENCNNCHSVHGSNIAPLLKTRAPFLCMNCHNGPHNSKNPVGPNAGGAQGGMQRSGSTATGLPAADYTGRGCMNCHSMVHGSNHPAGALLHR